MSSIQTRPASLPTSSAASVVLHGGFVIAGIVTTLIGPILPILIGRWSLTDQRALFFTAQFCGSMAGVASLGWLIKPGYRPAFVCWLQPDRGGVAGLNLGSYVASWLQPRGSAVDWGRFFLPRTYGWRKLRKPVEWRHSAF